MFSLFGQSLSNASDTFEVWLNGNYTTSEVPLRFQFSESEKLDCINNQLVQLKVSSSAAF